MKTANYMLDEDYEFGPANDKRVIPAYSFVVPIDYSYVPKHIKDMHVSFMINREVFCYTRYGILPIPKKSIRKVE